MSENFGDPFRGPAIPQGRMVHLLAAAAQRFMKLLSKQFPIAPYQDICAESHSDGALCVFG